MAGELGTFEDFLVNQNAQIDITYFIIALIVSAILSFILGKLYIKYGRALSNRTKFAGNFVLITTTTTLIIMIVKSSLALSLGLVGALSIVRFRAAIKEPEELAFLFLCISIGLGLGADQLGITLIAFVIISILIFGRNFYYKKEENQNLYITVSGKLSPNLDLKSISDVLKKYCSAVQLKRFDKTDEDILEAAFLVDFESFDKLEKAKRELNSLSKAINISYLDNSAAY